MRPDPADVGPRRLVRHHFDRVRSHARDRQVRDGEPPTEQLDLAIIEAHERRRDHVDRQRIRTGEQHPRHPWRWLERSLKLSSPRSGERRVGKECRYRWAPYPLKKKK